MTRWIAAGGAFVVSLDSMVNIAFPSMAAAFGAAPEQVRWVIVSYVLAYALLSFAGGTAGDRLGHLLVFRLGLAGSVVGYALAGGAGTFGGLLAGRMVQGIAAGLVYGTAPALVMLAARPSARGRAAGFVNGAIALAFALGPVLAGALVARFGWRAVFHARIPLALAALAALTIRTRAGGARGRPGPFRFNEPGAPGASHRAESAAPGDVLRPRVLHAGALAFVANAAIFAIWLLGPFDLVERRGLGERVGGLLFTLTPLGMALGAPAAGRATDRLGPHPPVVAGLVLEAAGLAVLGAADAATPTPLVAVALLGAGLGLGLFQVPNMAALMAEFGPARQGAAGGLVFLARTLGVVAGVAAFGSLFAARRAAGGLDAAFSTAFLLAAGLAALAAALAVRAILARTCRQPTDGSSSRSP